MEFTYNPGIFAVNDIPQAMRIILTPEGSTTEQRWRTETGYLADMIMERLGVTADSVLLDYGCGIGRMAKELIARCGCRVVGVDISTNMRALGVIYAQTDRFLACSPDMLDGLVARGVRFDGAIAVWVLQHCERPAEDIERIRRALRPEAGLFVANAFGRSLPTVERGWVDDGFDVRAALAGTFDLQTEGRFDLEKTTELIVTHTYWADFRRRPDR